MTKRAPKPKDYGYSFTGQSYGFVSNDQQPAKISTTMICNYCGRWATSYNWWTPPMVFCSYRRCPNKPASVGELRLSNFRKRAKRQIKFDI